MTFEAGIIRDGDHVKFVGLMCGARDELEFNSEVSAADCLHGGIEKTVNAAKEAFQKAGYLIIEAPVGFIAVNSLDMNLTEEEVNAKANQFFEILDSAFNGLGTRLLSQVPYEITAQ